LAGARLGKKGKDVDLYSASHVQDTSNAHFVTETGRQAVYLGHHPWPAGSASQQ